jgi:hypothetical protein
MIVKFPFASETTSNVAGYLAVARNDNTGQSSTTHGYVTGGAPASQPQATAIEKFPFEADGNATDVGDLSNARYGAAGQSSDTHGYVSGGDQYDINPSFRTVISIEKFPFAADANAASVGDLTWARGITPSGTSSRESGFTAGGRGHPLPAGGSNANARNIIDKFSFTSDGNATDVGDLMTTIYDTTGQQV